MKRWLVRIGFILLGLVIGIPTFTYLAFTSFLRIPTIELEHESLSVIALGRGVNAAARGRIYWQSVYPVKLLINKGEWVDPAFEIHPELYWPTMKVSLSDRFAGEGLSLSLDGAPCLRLKLADRDFGHTALSKTLEMPPNCDRSPDFGKEHALNVVVTNATGDVLSSYKLKYRFRYNGLMVSGKI